MYVAIKVVIQFDQTLIISMLDDKSGLFFLLVPLLLPSFRNVGEDLKCLTWIARRQE